VMEAQLTALQAHAKAGFEQLCAEFPEQEKLGGLVFLGRHYAERPPGILMLGINPGASEYKRLSADLQKHNWLLEGDAGHRVRYWTNARFLFGTDPELRHAMEHATFSFCCPYRTLKSNGLPTALIRALIRNSKPVLKQMLTDCAPRIVIVAGVEGMRLFGYTADIEVDQLPVLSSGGDTSGTYQWRAVQAEFDGAPFVLVQIPHLSRAGSRRRLDECRTWLTDVIRHAGVTGGA
jgi:hypothetical protein